MYTLPSWLHSHATGNWHYFSFQTFPSNRYSERRHLVQTHPKHHYQDHSHSSTVQYETRKSGVSILLSFSSYLDRKQLYDGRNMRRHWYLFSPDHLCAHPPVSIYIISPNKGMRYYSIFSGLCFPWPIVYYIYTRMIVSCILHLPQYTHMDRTNRTTTCLIALLNVPSLIVLLVNTYIRWIGLEPAKLFLTRRDYFLSYISYVVTVA